MIIIIIIIIINNNNNNNNKKSKGETEEEMEGILDQVLSIFRLVEGKDVFQAFFRNDLAKRLLLGKSSDFDIEKTLITKLRQGYFYYYYFIYYLI